jgi:pyruvate,orthophosphate dikinase
MLQTRDGKRTAQAAVRIAVDMAEEGLDQPKRPCCGSRRIRWTFSCIPSSSRKPQAAREMGQMLARGLNVSPGAAVRWWPWMPIWRKPGPKKEGKAVIMVRPETKPDDVHGMLAAKGILTSRGGRTSHAALVARQFGKPAVVGVAQLKIDMGKRRDERRQTIIHEGDWISIDGTIGEVFRAAENHGAGHQRPLADQAAVLGRRVPPPGGLGQRRLSPDDASGPGNTAPRASACAAPSTCFSNRPAAHHPER